jgi:hypothetical protein
MIASGAVPALLPAHIGVSQTSRFTTQAGLADTQRLPGRGVTRRREAARLTSRRSPASARCPADHGGESPQDHGGTQPDRFFPLARRS